MVGEWGIEAERASSVKKSIGDVLLRDGPSPVIGRRTADATIGADVNPPILQLDTYEKRIKMIKKMEFFKKRCRVVFIIGVICVMALSGVLLTISQSSKPQPQNPTIIEEAVSKAIKDQSKNYGAGEVSTEGHIILDTEEKDRKIIVYTIGSYGAFGFENGIFTKVSGSGAIPTVMTFSKNENGEYVLQDYKEPMDGSYYTKSIKEMFPKRLWYKVYSVSKKYSELVKQQENQVVEYLKSISRDAEVKAAYVEKKLPEINVDASNKIFSEYMKYDSELNNFPYWIGTRELLQNGVRYIYETSQSKTDDGYDLIIFKKTKEDGSVVLEYRYKIAGSEPELLNK
ncbi:MAG: transcriptional regulator [Bacillota bacterium]